MKTNQSKTIQKLLLSTVIGINALFLTNCKKEDQTKQEVKVETEALSTNDAASLMAVAAPSIDASYYRIENSLPSGYVKDGSVDYTQYLQAAMYRYPKIVFPAFPIMVSAPGVNVPSDRIITFVAGAKLVMKPTASGNYNMLCIKGATNVKVYDAVIVGDLKSHIGTIGEWGHCIGVYSSTNVYIYNAKLSYSWGDGIYVGTSSVRIPSKNVVIDNAYVVHSGRNGISLTCVDGVTVKDSYAAYSQYKLPMDGLCIEPNDQYDEIKNVVVDNLKTEENHGDGIEVALNLFYRGGVSKNISINVNKHFDNRSVNGFKTNIEPSLSVNGARISGQIIVTDPIWRKNSEKYLKTGLLLEPLIKLTMVRPGMIDMGGTYLTKAQILTYLSSKYNMAPTANYSIQW